MASGGHVRYSFLGIFEEERITEHAESDRLRDVACAWRACASYVYAMRSSSWTERKVVDISMFLFVL